MVYRLQCLDQGIRGRPGRFQKIEADFTRAEMHVWVADGSGEGDGWGVERVGRGEGEGEVPEAG